MNLKKRILTALIGLLAIVVTHHIAGAETTSAVALLIVIISGATIGWVTMPPIVQRGAQHH